MDLNNVTVEMRPRGEWEAVDFGVRLVRRDASAIYKIWFAISLPLLALAAAAILYSPYPMLATFLYWWFEPITDGPILRIISRRLFGEDANIRSALRSTPYLTLRNYIFLLPIYRFHMARSTAIPVTQLEGLRGASRRARAKVLNIKISNHGMGVTLAYHHLLLALYFGVYLIVYVLIPTTYQDSAGAAWLEMPLNDGDRTMMLASLALFYIAQSALHPWFVGAGFGLYINCRTQLEAWDIEVAFRRMVQRRTAGLAFAALLFATILPLALMPENAFARDDTEPQTSESVDTGFVGYWDDKETRAALNAAFANEALETDQQTEVWRRIEAAEDKSAPERESSGWFFDAIRDIGKLFSFLIEFGLWILLAFLLGLIFVTRGRWLPYVGFGLPGPTKTRRVILSSGEVTAESLPSDIPAEVTRLWRANKKRDALSLLYRGSVFAVVANHGVRLPASATEGLCIAAIKEQTAPDRADFFAQIVHNWVLCAYGFRSPDDEAVYSICADWQQHFEVAQ